MPVMDYRPAANSPPRCWTCAIGSHRRFPFISRTRSVQGQHHGTPVLWVVGLPRGERTHQRHNQLPRNQAPLRRDALVIDGVPVVVAASALRIGASALLRSDLVVGVVGSRKCSRIPSRCVRASLWWCATPFGVRVAETPLLSSGSVRLFTSPLSSSWPTV